MKWPSATEVRAGLVVMAAFAATVAQAELPTTAPERWLEIEQAGVAARARLFELSRIALPLCPEEATWTFGPLPFHIARIEPSHEPTKQVRQMVMSEFAAVPGDDVFLSAPLGLPFGAAGAQRGDRISPADGRVWNPVDELLAQASAPASSPSRRTYLQITKDLSADFAADPVRAFVLLRGGDSIPIRATAVKACPTPLGVIDSKYSYADIQGRAVVVTAPLLASLDDRQTTMMLANELSHLLLRHGPGPMGDFAQSLILGSLFDIARNRETKRLPFPDEELIQGDRLTLWLLKAYGIGPRAYLEFLEAMEARGGTLQVASYSRTRPLTGKRAEELRANIALFEAKGGLKLPKGLALSALREVGSTAMQLRIGASGRSSPPAAHAWVPPRPSGFAAIDDADSVPVRGEGKDRYRHYLTLPSPKAFFVYASGGWRFYFGTPEAMALGLDRCERENTPCWLYAVDDQVVWQADAAQRTGSKAALQRRP
jgi:hypothetical protein